MTEAHIDLGQLGSIKSESYLILKKNYMNKFFILDLHDMNMSNLNLNELFSEMFPFDRWTIVEPLLARDGCHGIAIATDGPPGNVMIIGELQRCLSTATFFPATVFKKLLALFVRYRQEKRRFAQK